MAYSAAPCIEHASTKSPAAVKKCVCSLSAQLKQLCSWSEMNTASEMTYTILCVKNSHSQDKRCAYSIKR